MKKSILIGIILIGGILLLFPVETLAQVELTLQDCITIALRDNKELKAYGAQALSRGEEVRIARKEFLPSLKAEGEYTLHDESDRCIFSSNIFGPGFPPEDTEFSAENQNIHGFTLTIEQPLFTGGRLSHSLEKSKTAQKGSLFEVKRQRALLTSKVKSVFYEFMKERRCKEALERLIEAKRKRLSVLEDRYGQGYVQKEEIMQEETDIAFVNLDLGKSRDRESLAVSKLKQLLSYPEHEEITLKGDLLNGHLSVSLQETKEAALRNRDDLQVFLARMKAAQEDVAIARSRFYPQASFEGNYTRQNETNITRPKVWTLKAQIDWSLFEWGKTQAEVARAQVERQGVIHSHEALRQEIMLEVEDAWIAVREKEELIDAHEKKLKTAEYKIGIIRDKYSEGQVKLIDVIEMETEMVRAYNEYLIAIADLDIELARLESSTSIFHDDWFKRKEVYQPDQSRD